ncbi:MAG TPA: bifunctional UDP-sugar hydrolase/5'-nucleotidase [Kofleriaceae bacterium]
MAWIAFAALASSACTVTEPQPNLVGQDIRLTVIHTADIHSRLFPYTFVPNTFDQGYGLLPVNAPFGGIARISTLVKEIRQTSDRSIWLDSGDCFQGAPVFNEFKGEAEMRSLSLAGLDGAVVGNHEFDAGSLNLFHKIDKWAQFPELAANYAWDDPPASIQDPDGRSLRDVVSPFELYDVQGVKIGVIGMGNTSTLTSIYEGGNSLGFRPISDPVAVNQWVAFLRPQVDLIIIVSHLGLDEDEDLTPAEVDDPNAALPLQGVDVILGGHLHIVTNPPKIIPNDTEGNYTILQHSGAFAKYVGRLDLVVHMGEDNSDPTKRSRITSFAYINIPVDSHVNDDPDIANLMWPYSVKINQDIDLNGVFAYVDPQPAGTKIVRNDNSGGDSQLGNLVARSMQLQQGVEAEFALTNSLGIRADFERGPLTNEDMYNVFPFENTIVVMYLSGVEVQTMLDFVAQRSAERGCRSQAQVAGIAFDMVCNGDCGAGVTACAKHIYLGDNCRVDDNGVLNSDGPINPHKCALLSPTGLYRVAVNDYIAAGGSGFDVLKRNSSKQNTGISLRDSLTVYLNAQTKCTADVVDETDTQMPQRTVVQRYGSISCLDEKIEQHDGRIRPVFE